MKALNVIRRIGWELWLPIVALVAWYVLSENSTSFYFPPLSKILSESVGIWFWGGIVEDVIPSVGRLIGGFVVGTAVAIALGVGLGLWRAGEDAVRPVLDFIRAIPGVALLPLVILFLGVGFEMKIVMIALVAFWPVLLNTIDAVRSVEPLQLQVGRTFHLSRGQNLRFIVLPSSLPQIFAGARTALATSTIAMIFTEMVGSPGGIGYFILDAQRNYNTVAMWSGILVLGIVGYLLNNVFRLIEINVLSWHHTLNARGKGE